MTLPIEAKDVAAGDYSPTEGTIKKVVEHRNPKSGNLESLDIYWTNGEELLGVTPDRIFDLVQGREVRPSQSVRPGLAADHSRE